MKLEKITFLKTGDFLTALNKRNRKLLSYITTKAFYSP